MLKIVNVIAQRWQRAPILFNRESRIWLVALHTKSDSQMSASLIAVSL